MSGKIVKEYIEKNFKNIVVVDKKIGGDYSVEFNLLGEEKSLNEGINILKEKKLIQ